MNVAGLVLEADAECHSRSPIDRPTPLFQRDVGVRVLRQQFHQLIGIRLFAGADTGFNQNLIQRVNRNFE